MKASMRFGRLIVGTVALLLLAAAGFQAVWAWNTHRVEQENLLTSHTVQVEIQETFNANQRTVGGTKTKQVTVKNTGTGTAFVRVCFAEYWDTEADHLSGVDEVVKNWSSDWTTDWEKKADGWYYYKKVLPANGTVTILNSVTFPSAAPESASYHLNFQAEAVQASDEQAVNTDATQTLFGRTATLSNAVISFGAVVSGDVAWS